MAAVAKIEFYTGAGQTASADQTGLTVRYKQADDMTVDNVAPVPKPASGLAFSYRKSSKLNFTGTPAGSITNLRWFTTTPPTNVEIYSRSVASYTQAVAGDTAGITGFTDTGGNQATNGSANRTAAAPLVINAGTVISNPTTGVGTQNYLETQMSIAAAYAAGPGPTGAMTATYRYSET